MLVYIYGFTYLFYHPRGEEASKELVSRHYVENMQMDSTLSPAGVRDHLNERQMHL